MTALAARIRVRFDEDRGAFLVWWVIVFFAGLVVLGLVVDGGGKLYAAQRAQLTAEEAARGAGQAIIVPLGKRGISATVNPFTAAAEAQRYLLQAGIPGFAVPSGPNTVLVTTITTYQPKVLGIIGLGPQTVTGQAIVHLNRTNTGNPWEEAGLP